MIHNVVLANAWTRLLTANSTDTSFTSLVATTTEPSGTGVITLFSNNLYVPEKLLIVPFGAGNDDTTFDMRVTGWRPVSDLWIPTTLYTFGCTLSTSVGVADEAVINTDRLVDTISLTSGHGDDNVDVNITSPANNTPGLIVCLTKGFRKVQITFDMTGATGGNCLYATL